MVIKNNVSSQPYNTFGIDVNFSTLIEITQRQDLQRLYHSGVLRQAQVLGGGSNVLLTADQKEPVIVLKNQGIEVIQESEVDVLVQMESGQNWHQAVLWAIEQNYGGIENMSLIPGNCGAAPMQNIGAYGIEIKDVLHSVSAMDKEDGSTYTFHNSECGFGYRTSFFKTKWKNRYLIVDIVLRLTKPDHHTINISYGAIKEKLEELAITNPSIKNVSDTVIAIRQSKLPDPRTLGNAGSFFKNPVIPLAQFKKLLALHPSIPNYPAGDNVKIPAAWLIDQAGWKGKVVGKTGTYKHQPLVLINHGGAEGQAVYDLSEKILLSVKSRFGVELEREVNVW